MNPTKFHVLTLAAPQLYMYPYRLRSTPVLTYLFIALFERRLIGSLSLKRYPRQMASLARRPIDSGRVGYQTVFLTSSVDGHTQGRLIGTEDREPTSQKMAILGFH